MGQVYLKAILKKKQEKPKSKLAAKGHNKGSNNPSTKVSKVTQKKVSGEQYWATKELLWSTENELKDMC